MNLVWQIEVEIANRQTKPQAYMDAEIVVQTYYRRRKDYFGLKLERAKRLKKLEKENSLCKRRVDELSE